MIEQERADRREPAQIIFVRGVIAVPGDDVEGEWPISQAWNFRTI